MKPAALFMSAVALSLLVMAVPSAALAGGPTQPTLPEPTSLIVWGGLACAGGVAYWWRNRRKD